MGRVFPAAGRWGCRSLKTKLDQRVGVSGLYGWRFIARTLFSSSSGEPPGPSVARPEDRLRETGGPSGTEGDLFTHALCCLSSRQVRAIARRWVPRSAPRRRGLPEDDESRETEGNREFPALENTVHPREGGDPGLSCNETG